ncbi:hypothetical protein SYNPS1DRAFT_28272 [Syncephalis pseudoplumigaleata]|uniref:Uncharacterized protein n=1 Tax=Syncephalis pseudoplumigaleata TaxID=1712513 RepID=A0A4P9Z214_9FUNG|nr:hypothetical protein SYNPS1DRAFT_28272 [Syncephalis pseudoplumigaleata]|eukprot:RKP26012.1 hypothetical protein SYNPS1DRAFT_28272 [Syncephalis pseudoplumigaleata]
MRLRQLFNEVVIPCKRQFLARLQGKATAPCQSTPGAGHCHQQTHHHHHHHHHYQQQRQPSIVELLRASQQARSYSSHAFAQHPTFTRWQHMMAADAARAAWFQARARPVAGSPLMELLRARLLVLANLFAHNNHSAVCENARQFWMKARRHGFARGGPMFFKPPFSSPVQRQNCIFTRLAEMRRAAMAPGVPRGYATAIARCHVVPQPAKTAFFAGRLFATPFGTFSTKHIGSTHPSEQGDRLQQDQTQFRRRFKRSIRAKRSSSSSSKFAGARIENNRVADMAARPQSIRHCDEAIAHLETSTRNAAAEEEEEVAATLIVDPDVYTPATATATPSPSNEHEQLEQTQVLASPPPPVPTPAIMEPEPCNEPDSAADMLPANSRYCVAFLLPGPPLYDYLMLDHSNNSSGSHGGSVVDESFMRRLTEVMGLNRRQLELVAQALSLLRERIPRLDVRLEGYEVRVFMPLGTPVATVRHWLHEAGLHEGQQYIFESVSSLRAAASQRGSSRMSQGSRSTRSSASPMSQRDFTAGAENRPSNPTRDIHAFLARADALARDTTAFARPATATNARPRCSPSVRLAAARSYSAALNYVF